MTRLIKVSDQVSDHVYSKPTFVPPQVHESPDVLARREAEQALAAALARERASVEEIERLRNDHIQACKEAYAKGFEEGQAAATRSHDKQVEAFERAAGKVTSTIEDQLVALHDLSVDIALTALSQIVSDPEGRRQTIRDTVSRMVAGLSGRDILSIEVSTRDFPDTASRETLLEIGQRHGFAVTMGDGPTGTCTAQLQLGTIDLNLSTQLTRLGDVIQGWKP